MLAQLRTEKEPEWDARTVESLGMIPNYYLEYFYYTGKKLADQEKWPPSRGEEVIGIEKELLRDYADPALVEPLAGLMLRGGAYYSTLATRLIDSHANDLGQVEVVNVRQGGAVPGWPADWVLELPARIDRQGIHPLPAEPLPPACFGLVAQVKSYELLTVEAAVHGDRRAAYQALLAHPLGPPADRVQDVLDDLLETNKKFLPQFFA
jgi:6-phospho-beta-glucosidase